jgi:hypothetical protein
MSFLLPFTANSFTIRRILRKVSPSGEDIFILKMFVQRQRLVKCSVTMALDQHSFKALMKGGANKLKFIRPFQYEGQINT